MTAVEVAKLSLRCPTAQRERARFVLEDALRTELPDDGRLVLLRRMKIAPTGSSDRPGQRQAAMRQAWAVATGGARHGGEDRAGEANCVWFTSRDEAERLLLARLLAGRVADGWFWKLALPDWRGRPAEPWLGEILADAMMRQDDRRVLALVEACIAHGSEMLLAAALASGAPPTPGVAFTPWMAESLRPAPTRPEGEPDAPRQEAATRFAVAIFASLPDAVRNLLIRLDSTGAQARSAATAVVRAFVLRRSPALALDRALLERTVVEGQRLVRSGIPDLPPHEGENFSRANAKSLRKARGLRLRGDAEKTELDDPQQDPPASTRPHVPTDEASQPPPETPEHPTPPIAFERLRSRHAGLWLVLPSLQAMGLGQWLTDRPALLAAHPGRQLVLAIARHHRVSSTDPALAVLAPEPDEPLPEWTVAWRRALDHWLRRRARRRLHDLVRRPGVLDWSELRLDIRFPPADADIRLRRLALDRDPGWTEWLGLAVRYHFSEASLP